MNHLSGKFRLFTLLASFMMVSCVFGGFDIDDTPKEYVETVTSGAVLTDGHDCVDLGLSVKWATSNLGAYSDKYIGNYYAWGETVEKGQYSKVNYTYGILSLEEDWYMTKYCPDSLFGYDNFYDGMSVLEPEDDVVRALWKGEWRLPTPGEQQELVDNCIWTWVLSKDNRGREICGFMVTSNIEGYKDRSIFLPAGGCKDGSYTVRLGSTGVYWSSGIYLADGLVPPYASAIYFEKGIKDKQEKIRVSAESRELGLTVRPVHP